MAIGAGYARASMPANTASLSVRDKDAKTHEAGGIIDAPSLNGQRIENRLTILKASGNVAPRSEETRWRMA